LFATVASGIIFRRLDTSVGVSGPHDFAVRKHAPFVNSATCVHRILSRVCDDRETPLEWDRTGELLEMICVNREAKYFCEGGLDR
jgi:hypothetical protein